MPFSLVLRSCFPPILVPADFTHLSSPYLPYRVPFDMCVVESAPDPPDPPVRKAEWTGTWMLTPRDVPYILIVSVPIALGSLAQAAHPVPRALCAISNPSPGAPSLFLSLSPLVPFHSRHL